MQPITVQVSSDGFDGFAMPICQLLKGFLTEEIFFKQFLLPFCRVIFANKLGMALFAKIELRPVAGSTVLDYLK